MAVGNVPVVLHEGKDHVALQTGLLVPLARTAIDFTEAFSIANYPFRTVKGALSVAGDVTSASANLEKQTSHDSTQLLAFSCGVLKALFQKNQQQPRELLTQILLEI